ncbi:MAG TPA: hypothetical protein VGT41_00710, partial [Candidatus Babeliales bacterium]|nr:hypothetical protein [Candidatus Babeliales bacterium]
MNQILKKLMVTALFIISALFSENSLFGDGFVTSRLKTEQAWTTGVAQETRLAQEQREKVAEETFAAEGARVKAEQEWATEERARIAERKAEEERARVQVLESLQDYPAGDSVSFHEDGTQWGDQLQELLARKTAQEQEQREKVAGETFAAEGARLKAEQEWATEERARIAQARHTRIQEARLGSSEYVESAMVAPEAVQPVAPDISPTILQESPAVDSFVKTERTAASNANKQAAITRQQAQAATQERTALENVGKLADAYVELVDSEKKLAQDESDLTAQLKRNEVLLGHAKSGVKVEQLKVERKDDDLLWDAVVEGDQQLTDDQITADRRFALYEQEAKSAAEFEEFVAARKAAHEQEAAMRQQQIYRKRTENDLAVVDVAGEKYLADIAQARHSRIQEARLGSSEYVEPVMVAPEAPKLEAPDLSPTMLQELPAVDSLIKTERIAASNANKQAVITRQQAQAATQERTALENVGKLADAYVELVNSEKNLAQDESDLTAQLKRDEVLLGHAKSGVKVEQLKVERKGDDLLWDAVVEGDQQLTDDQIAADRRRALYARDAELAAEFEEFVAARKARQEQVAILDARKVQEKSLSEFELAAQLAEMQADQDDRQALARKAAHEQEAAMRQQQIYRKRTESDSTVVDAAGEKYLADITQARHTRIQEARLGSPEYVEPVMVAPEAPKLEASDISPTILQESPAVDSLIKVERAEAAKANKQGIVARQQAQAQEAKRAVD